MSFKVAPPNILQVNEVQKGNPILQFIKNVKWSFDKNVVPDYVMTQACAIFVSVKYHFRHPKYVAKRIQEVGKNFRLRILLVLVDDETNLSAMQDLNKIAFASEFTLILSWSNIEAARYLETFKNYETKSSTSIQEKEETEYLPKVTKVLGNIRAINKTDVITMLDVFGNLSNICQATEQQLILCPGLGEKKVKRLHSVLHQPFIRKARPAEPEGVTVIVDTVSDSKVSGGGVTGSSSDTVMKTTAKRKRKAPVAAIPTNVPTAEMTTLASFLFSSTQPQPRTSSSSSVAAVPSGEVIDLTTSP